MVHGGQDISFKVIPIDNDGIKLEEETGSSLLHWLSDSLLRLLVGSDYLSDSLLRLLLIRIELIPSNHPLDLPGRDPFGIFCLIKYCQLLLPVVRMSLP
jgi:hypothetical protein